jgi:CheY-like chemotaxis protein
MSGKKRVLLVDDDPTVVSYLTTKLSKLYEVVATSDPRKVVALARRELPDVILCDIDMPHMSGGEVAAELAADSGLARIPFLYLTDLVSPQEARELDGQVGGRPGIAKRAPMADLVARINELVDAA